MARVFSFLGAVLFGLRSRLLLLVVIACVPLVVLTLHSAWEARRRARSGWEEKAQKLADFADHEEAKLIGGTRQLLMAVAESAPVRSLSQAGTQRLMDHLFRSYPRYANLGVARPNGQVLAAALPANENQATRTYFKRAVESRAFSLGDFPTNTTIARPTLSFGYPVIGANGKIQAVVFASLDLDWLSRFGSEIPGQLPKSAVWKQMTRDGQILFSFVGSGAHPTSVVPSRQLMATLFERRKGFVELDEQGTPIFYAFSVMESQFAGMPVIALMGIQRDELFAESDLTLARNLSWLGIALGLALFLGWAGANLLVLQRVNALVQSSTRLAQGDLRARTGLTPGRDELGKLMLAFDQMAQALENRQKEQQLSNDMLQRLSRRLVEVQEAERRHIARELHDEVGQSLTAAQINLQAAMTSSDLETMTPRLKASAEMIQRVVEQVHDLSLNLRPSMLDDFGLEPALRWYTSRQSELNGLKTSFEAEPLQARLDPVIETECFRVAQEALTNVARHSHAKSVAVKLVKQNGHLELRVRDDGVGFDVSAKREQAVRGSSMGLLSMRERTALAGGGLDLQSEPGRGTEVRAWFPLKWRNSSA